jgi:hypothetical protein
MLSSPNGFKARERTSMKLSDDIAKMTAAMENDGSQPTRQEVYTILLRVMIELRRQDHEIKVLKDKLND